MDAASLGWGGRVGYSMLFLPESQALLTLPILRFPGQPLLCKRLTHAAQPPVCTSPYRLSALAMMATIRKALADQDAIIQKLEVMTGNGRP